MTIDSLIAEYRNLGDALRTEVPHEESHQILSTIVSLGSESLESASRESLISRVPDKEYFRFAYGGKYSRAVNSKLWEDDHGKLCRNLSVILSGAGNLNANEINRTLYSATISFCCMVDLLKNRDQKTPGTYFEYLIRSVISTVLGVKAQTNVEVLNLDEQARLPTDLIFDLGSKRPKFHVPVKTSTRERVIQLWAHQRVLDGVYGVGRFFGMPMILTETKTDSRRREVTEICLPLQWRLYQMHISQMWKICYLDLPKKYEALSDEFPIIPVTTVGDLLVGGSDLRQLVNG